MAVLICKPIKLIFCVFYLVIIFSGQSSTAELLKLRQPAKPDGTLSFLVIGDWGRKGSYNQSQVASQMGKIGENLDIDFVISTGDNFYDNGLTGWYDHAFQESFSNIYTSPSLQKPWYTVLGNHDYRGDVGAQLSPFLRVLDKRWICMRSFIVNSENVDFFFVDTTPFVDKYFVQPNKHVYDWRGILPRQNYIDNLLTEMEGKLRESSAKWKIVIGHHTMKSAGHHGNTIELEKHLLPILHSNDVDLYINGHDHCLEHISNVDSKIQFMTSGGGSKAWKGDVSINLDSQEMRFYYDGQGFMSVHITESELRVVFYDVFGHVLHQWKAYKEKEALYMSS